MSSGQDSPEQRRRGHVLSQGCLVCGGDLFGNRRHGFVCIRCNLSFTERNLISAGKLPAHGRVKSDKAYYAHTFPSPERREEE